ncbi:MAG: DUF493 domain-containing protein [Pseudomonadota bacterium]
MKEIDQKVAIEYPCLWLYKIIGTGEDELLDAIREILGEAEYTLSLSNTSRTGKYLSFNLEVMVHSEEARNYFFAAIREHSSVKMVL